MKNNGFTLIELIMVIAILAIISTLAISKVGNVKEKAARRVSLSNIKSTSGAVDSYVALGGKLSRLDSLVYADEKGTFKEGFNFDSKANLYAGPIDAEGEDVEKNKGLSSGLLGVLCEYHIKPDSKESKALEALGMEYVMSAYPKALGFPARNGYAKGDDGSIPSAQNGLDPELSFCIARSAVSNRVFAAVNPLTDLGRIIYQDCGQELLSNKGWGESYDEATVISEVKATGGPLLAFGLGSSATIVGNSEAGIDAAPYSEVLSSKYYRQYIVLIRLRTIGAGAVSSVTAEFAGILDPEGNSMRAARHLLK